MLELGSAVYLRLSSRKLQRLGPTSGMSQFKAFGAGSGGTGLSHKDKVAVQNNPF